MHEVVVFILLEAARSHIVALSVDKTDHLSVEQQSDALCFTVWKK